MAANSFLNARHGHNRPSALPEEHSATSEHLVILWQEGGGGCVLLVTQGRLFLPNGTNYGAQGRRKDRIIVSDISIGDTSKKNALVFILISVYKIRAFSVYSGILNFPCCYVGLS